MQSTADVLLPSKIMDVQDAATSKQDSASLAEEEMKMDLEKSRKESDSEESGDDDVSSAATHSVKPDKMRPSGQIKTLLDKQQREFPRILAELEKHEEKVSHWAWWVFPTDKEGYSEPYPLTRVTPTNCFHLCEADTVLDWRRILEIICDLLEANEESGRHVPEKPPRASNRVLPRIDHGRVHFFIEFWQDNEHSPGWLKEVCVRLACYDWGEKPRGGMGDASMRSNLGNTAKSTSSISSFFKRQRT
jgi:hypothetical protein